MACLQSARQTVQTVSRSCSCLVHQGVESSLVHGQHNHARSLTHVLDLLLYRSEISRFNDGIARPQGGPESWFVDRIGQSSPGRNRQFLTPHLGPLVHSSKHPPTSRNAQETLSAAIRQSTGPIGLLGTSEIAVDPCGQTFVTHTSNSSRRGNGASSTGALCALHTAARVCVSFPMLVVG